MKKHLTENEISLAREIFVSLAVQHKTQDFNKQMASASIRLARIFSEAVQDENSDCEDFKFDPVKLDSVNPIFELQNTNIPRFDEMSCCYEKFDIFGPSHKSKYEKIEVIEGTITCNLFGINGIEDSYIEHTYPDWVVAKFTDKHGIVWGASSDKFQYVDGMGIWVADNPSPKLKLAILMYEKCTVAPQDSLVSIDLPF